MCNDTKTKEKKTAARKWSRGERRTRFDAGSFVRRLSTMHTRIALYKRSEWYCLCRKCFVRREIVIELRAVDVHHGLRSDRNPIRGKL